MKHFKSSLKSNLYYAAWRAINLTKNKVFPDEVTQALVKATVYIESAGIEGDVAEFGTWTGRSARKIYVALRGRRPLHLFDSFEGLPTSTATEDLSCPSLINGVWQRGQMEGITAHELKRICPHAIIHGGWYSKTVPALDPAIRFAMLHIDCDLYSSTMDALSPLFSRGMISEGAVILFDDWSCNRASNQYGERAAWARLCKDFSIDYEDDGSYGWTQKRMIVHGYRKP